MEFPNHTNLRYPPYRFKLDEVFETLPRAHLLKIEGIYVPFLKFV